MRLACNYVPIFSRFRAITIYLSKISVFSPFYPSQSHDARVLLEPRVWKLVQKNCSPYATGGERCVIVRSLVLRQHRCVLIESFDWRDVRLKLTNVTLQDAGLYTCEGFNVFGRQLTTGQLIVRRGLLIKIASKQKAHLYAVNGIRVSGRIFIVLVLN